MKIKRKILSTILAILGMAIIGLAILYFLGVFKEQEAGILIETDPVATVYIDNLELGKTPFEINRKPGEISIRVKPDKINDLVLDDYETKISLIPGIKTIIKRDFRESEDYSSGATVSFEKLGGTESYVTVVSVPDNSQVLIDGRVYGYTPIRVKIPAGDHNLVVTADKYLEKSLPIRVYKGYKLTASVKLAKANESVPTSTPVPEEEFLFRVKIDKTDVGFLRVREGAGIGFPEVAQVKPGEEYGVIEEGEKGRWYKIKLPEIDGWVSAEFVTPI